MASPNIYVGGLGGSTGADLATATRVYASGTVYYVGNASSGSDAYAGTERNKPLATLAQAYTNASAGDIVVLLSGHAETLTSGQTLNKSRLTIIGEGSGTSRPTFTCGAAITFFAVTGNGVTLDNLLFNASTTVAPTDRIKITSTAVWLKNCKFNCGAYDTVPAVDMQTGAGQVRIQDCEFVSTATALASQPTSGVKVTNAMNDLWLDSATFDGGSYNWSSYAFNGGAAITGIRAINLRLLNSSDLTFATGTTGYVAERDPSGSARVVWTA